MGHSTHRQHSKHLHASMQVRSFRPTKKDFVKISTLSSYLSVGSMLDIQGPRVFDGTPSRSAPSVKTFQLPISWSLMSSIREYL